MKISTLFARALTVTSLALILGALPALSVRAAAAASDSRPAARLGGAPERAMPGDISGCWSADRTLYGLFTLSFCVEGTVGTYTVSGTGAGAGLTCAADFQWQRASGTYRLVLTKTPCGNNITWTADQVYCTVAPTALAPAAGSSADRGSVRGAALTCRYRPEPANLPSMPFVARRQNP